MTFRSCLLPEHITDILPSEAQKIEKLRRRVLDRFHTYGYEFVIPPLLEYLDSLLIGAGKDLEQYTFKLIDQLSGRTMGLRADITPQISRIDAHQLNRQGVTRLCYAGSVLHTHPAGLFSTREPYQIGAEIYGHLGLEADAEIQQLMLDSLVLAGLQQVRIDLCHVGILDILLANHAKEANEAKGGKATPTLPASEVFNAVFNALASKDVSALNAITVGWDATIRDPLLALPTLYGDLSVLAKAAACLPASAEIKRALDDLAFLANAAHGIEGVEVTIDLADLHGHQYHSGVMFSAYIDGVPNAVARGGRYDSVSQAYGRARAATGFSLDLREIAGISPLEAHNHAILAPWKPDISLQKKIAELRARGEVVIQSLSDQIPEGDFICNRKLVERCAAQWEVVSINTKACAYAAEWR